MPKSNSPTMLYNFLVTGHVGGRTFVLYHGDDEVLARKILHHVGVLGGRLPGQQRVKRKLWICDGRRVEGVPDGPLKLIARGYAKAG